ncbi:Uncharacterised protein [Sphingobacterium mizutaii]|uniref:Uncharacterized protein n=1 Tax=Sphingobacterium mizutaii TaxID=1010 RepID=A0AAJ4XCD3_9SPHI|nr:hypothetical protein SAMN05192578_1021 [Sphingobacterium mizutaii]SNV52690.1 Uncharacterised protein [Sphingobacterium mizutaii]
MELAGEFNSPLQYRCMLDKILANLQSQLSMNPERSRGGVESHPRSTFWGTNQVLLFN